MRVAVINYDFCKPNKCNLECIRFCPINRSGSKAIELSDSMRGKPVIYEETCIGCNICVKKCPFEAISIVNLPDRLSGEIIHRYKINGFELFGLPILKQGYILGILGKNGTGKTTIFKILSGELLPNFGDPGRTLTVDEILSKFKGREIYDYFYKLYNKELKIVHKIQYVEYVGRLLKGYVKEILAKVDERRKIDEVKELLFMENMWDKNVQTLSGGELQKLVVAAALLRDADVYFFDEPSSYLDIRERLNVAKGIRELTRNKYVAVIDHDLIVLDYLADLISIVYGESSVYGRVSKTYAARTGINIFLSGYLPAENVKFRQNEIKFNIKDLTDLDLSKTSKIKIEWTDIEKKLPGFSLYVKRGNAREGEVIGILGPNGIGKTTFARILVNEIPADQGVVYPQGLILSYKPQKLIPEYEGTVQQYLESVSKDILSTSSWFFEEVTRKLNLHRILESRVKDLSGGELQKLYITASLAKEADIYVFDEPSSYLDVEERYVVAKAIKRIVRERKSVAFVIDHDLAIHDYIADRIMVFSGISGKEGYGESPDTLRKGMNNFLKIMQITFRRDADTGRPRVNKPGSYLDRVQKEKGDYYSMEILKD